MNYSSQIEIPAASIRPDVVVESKVNYPWNPDLGDGTYRNPIIYADYSDPDVVRVGDDFYMVASSFNTSPGLPILHSRDLVNWTLINHAVKKCAESALRQRAAWLRHLGTGHSVSR